MVFIPKVSKTFALWCPFFTTPCSLGPPHGRTLRKWKTKSVPFCYMIKKSKIPYIGRNSCIFLNCSPSWLSRRSEDCIACKDRWHHQSWPACSTNLVLRRAPQCPKRAGLKKKDQLCSIAGSSGMYIYDIYLSLTLHRWAFVAVTGRPNYQVGIGQAEPGVICREWIFSRSSVEI